MRVHLTDGEQARTRAGGTKSVEAWENVVRGGELQSTFIRENNLEARRLAQATIAIDPGYANAWTILGWSHWCDVFGGWADSRQESLERAFEAAQKAFEIDNDYPETLSLLGFWYLIQGEHDEAVAALGKAAALAPNHAAITAMSGLTLTMSGKGEQGIELTKRAMRLSPTYPPWYLDTLGRSYYVMGERDKAVEVLRESIRRQPETVMPRVTYIVVLTEAGLSEEAKKVARDILRIEPTFSTLKWMQAIRYKDPIFQNKQLSNLREAGLPD